MAAGQSLRRVLKAGRAGVQAASRTLAEECPVAMVFDGGTQAVMMATPRDLEDFARGFAKTEGFITCDADIREIEIVRHEAGQGIEARLWLDAAQSQALQARRRSMMGPVGCGLCGIDSLAQAMRDIAPLSRDIPALALAPLLGASEALRHHQPLHDETHAVHAAGFFQPAKGITLAREDVGRHNALDKLIGAMGAAGVDPASGAIVITSRVSVEMVQKTVIAGAPVLIAVSAPTALALEVAEAAGLCVAALARNGTFEIFTHPERIDQG
ncbi:formate dehydrogenase accessory sulfurtransferase FdhD [Rhodobacteraceae bacterium XHP0102]|nr:formate dehydrogenase accessory sulfurtransferase FdhD [Rhodobacteraceae bacterium XHP0102]